MKLPVNWLKEFVDTKLSAEKIADKLTMAGLEVEEILGGHDFSGVVVGHVLSVEKHPNADKLNLAQIDIGDEKLQIVCGAANLKKGQKVAVALIGAKLGDSEIGKANLRGIDSYGMICSERELGISDKHEGILVLPADSVLGTDVSLLLGGEKVLDVKVLANRSDCMSIIGLAREVAVVMGSVFVIPGRKPVTQSDEGDPRVRSSSLSDEVSLISESNDKDDIEFMVKVEDSVLCPRYVARFVTNLQDTETPLWMKERLVACGVRPISLFVDISNYVMIKYGQPLHFFDLDKLTDKMIIVRPAKDGEVITTLDGVKRKLTRSVLVIANSKSPIALAGVMGGSDTEIDVNTKNIFIEAAVFEKSSIRKTSRALGLRSEAVARFEKGIAPMLPEVAINRAAELLHDLAKGEVSGTVVDVYPKVQKPKTINLDIAKMNYFLGTDILENEALDVLSSLGFTTIKVKGSYDVTAPFWRIDIAEEVDIYEEIIRIVGYDRVPYTLPFNIQSVPVANNYIKITKNIRERLAAIGFDEILTYSFIGAKELGALGVSVASAPEVQNPLVSDQQYLRPTLVPKMLEALRDNQYNVEILRFFEIGKSFVHTQAGKLPDETNWLSLGLSTDYYDAKGAIYNLLAQFGMADDEIVVKQTSADYLKKGMGADLFVRGKKLVTVGEIREEVREKFDIKRSVTIALLNIDVLLELNLPETKFVQFSKYQLVTRDISAVFSDSVTVQEIKQKLSRSNKLITKIEIKDIYTGKNLEVSERSITIRFYIQSEDHTLTDAEVDDVMKIVHNKITELGGNLRRGK